MGGGLEHRDVGDRGHPGRGDPLRGELARYRGSGVYVNEGTLARSLLSSAIDGLDPDPANVAALLDGIDGAFERAQLGVTQAAVGDTIALDEL
jgi:hypothetical protein